LSCKIHSWAGVIMLLSLLLAPVIVAFSPVSTYIPFEFRVFSIIVVLLAIFYLVKMAKGLKNRKLTGLYQRLSYWVKLIWISVLSLLLI